jgi:glycosyltransferase involved in cell wall biosynthesis
MFDFCDEIVVVDSFSTDKTIEIAKSFPQVNIFRISLKILQNKEILH